MCNFISCNIDCALLLASSTNYSESFHRCSVTWFVFFPLFFFFQDASVCDPTGKCCESTPQLALSESSHLIGELSVSCELFKRQSHEQSKTEMPQDQSNVSHTHPSIDQVSLALHARLPP